MMLVDASKMQYPKLWFSDNEGGVDYTAWKLEIKFFLKEFAGNFRDGQSQICIYFKATEGKAKKLILKRINPQHPMCFTTADDVLKALDASFYNFNKRANASTAYDDLKIKEGQLYQLF